MRGRKAKAIYVIYKGDRFVDLGTANELSEKLGIDKRTIQYYATKTFANNRAREKGIIALRIE